MTARDLKDILEKVPDRLEVLIAIPYDPETLSDVMEGSRGLLRKLDKVENKVIHGPRRVCVLS